MKCDQCQLLRINGVVCHEIGCPKAYKGTYYTCSGCGGEFKKKNARQVRCGRCVRILIQNLKH